MEIRFHSPYRHAVLGLAFEFVAYAAFIAVLVALTLLAAWIA